LCGQAYRELTLYQSDNRAADEGLPILLAWAEMETGRVPEAAALLRATWSMVDYLRAVVAEKQGTPPGASENCPPIRRRALAQDERGYTPMD
jgi:hypothetical protein